MKYALVAALIGLTMLQSECLTMFLAISQTKETDN